MGKFLILGLTENLGERLHQSLAIFSYIQARQRLPEKLASLLACRRSGLVKSAHLILDKRMKATFDDYDD